MSGRTRGEGEAETSNPDRGGGNLAREGDRNERSAASIQSLVFEQASLTVDDGEGDAASTTMAGDRERGVDRKPDFARRSLLRSLPQRKGEGKASPEVMHCMPHTPRRSPDKVLVKCLVRLSDVKLGPSRWEITFT